MVLPLTEESMKRFATLRGELRAQGLLIGDLDLLIAATAISTILFWLLVISGTFNVDPA
jgi:predicted nucleic acid-binding protein